MDHKNSEDRRPVYKAVLFDLDGTLSDSGRGIINGFTYAIEKMGRQVPLKEQLQRFIGPSLHDSFGRVLGYSPEDTKKAVAIYREYYNELGGALENELYPGIEKLLSDLKAEGKRLIIATAKATRATNAVVEYFKFDQYFEFIAASDDLLRPRKADVIRYALAECGITDLSKTVMIGDRDNDILAAKELGIDSIGVLYGYGSREELTAAGATHLAENTDDLKALIG